MTDPTPFAESNALLAMQAGDTEGAARIVRDMLPGERARLARAAKDLAEMCLLTNGCISRRHGGFGLHHGAHLH